MGKRGPPPTPTRLKLLRGNPGKRAINVNEPKPEPGIPIAPGHLSKDAKVEWDRITVELSTLGLLSQIDRSALAVYCTAWGRHVEAENHILAEGLMVSRQTLKRGPGKPLPNRWLGISNAAIDLMRHMLAEFGLTPAARTRLSVKAPKSKEKDSLFG